MFIRRALRVWLWVAVLVLPLWWLVGRGIIFASTGWDFILYLVLSLLLGIGLLIIAILISVRASVRLDQATSWTDVGVILAWHLAIIGFGIVDNPWLATAVILIGIAAFWTSLWQLIADSARRASRAMRDFNAEFQNLSQTQGGMPPGSPSSRNPREPRDVGELDEVDGVDLSAGDSDVEYVEAEEIELDDSPGAASSTGSDSVR